MTRPPMVDAALDYARQGFRVHPLRPGTKVPMLPAWQTAATTDPETIATWWGLNPTANVGIATGEASDLWVLDIDTGHGPDAALSLAALEAAHGPLSQTTEVVTPSGGRHLWYAWPRGGEAATWRNTNALGRGIDVRAEGGQVAVWPSVLADGTRYRRPKGRRTAPPAWLAEKAQYRDAASDGVRVQVADLTPAGADAAAQYGQRQLEAAVGELAALSEAAVADWTTERMAYRGPSWDDATFAAACRLLRLANADWTAVQRSDVAGILAESAPRDAGFGPADHARILASARQAVGGDAATLPTHLLNPLPLLDPPARAAGGEAIDPAAYFDKAGLRVADLARAADEGDLALGGDLRFHRYSEGVWLSDPTVVQRRVVRLLGNRFRIAHAATAEAVVLAEHGLPVLGDEPHEAYLNTRGGMLDWRTGTVIAHAPAWRSRHQLPIVVDPAATCPAFDRWLEQVATPETAPLLLEAMAYMLLPGNPLQRAFLVYGPGGNGKGTLMRLIASLVGKGAVAAVPLHDLAEGRFASAELYGAAVNLAGDIEARELRNTAPLKLITGGDRIRAERKYGQAFTFTCHATPMFSANELFRTPDATEGFLRRWVLLPMTADVRRLGPFDEHALYAEGAGILNRLLPAMQALMARGTFTETAASRELSARFADQADLVRTWLGEDDAVQDADPHRTDGAWRARSEVYARFRTWAQDSGHKPMSSTRFYARLDALGYVQARRAHGRGVYGIALDSLPGGMRPLGVSLLP